MNNTQEITIDNLAETLEYNGATRVESSYVTIKYKLFHIDQEFYIYWQEDISHIYLKMYDYDCNTILAINSPQSSISLFIEAIKPFIKLNPLPKPDNLWDWCLANGYKHTDDAHLSNEFSVISLQHMTYNCIEKPCRYVIWMCREVGYIYCNLPLEKQINLLNAFMEAYNETH